MSPDTDRIVVPTNGRGPHPDQVPATPGPAEPSGSPVPIAPFTPTQLAVGFAILAAIVALLAGRLRRRGSTRRRGPFGRG